MLLILSLSALACEEPLEVRTLYPREGSQDVPLNARLLVSFIGWGTTEEYSVQLTQDGEAVAATQDSWCYDHEGPHEVHCWVSLRPEELLSPESTYALQVKTTDAWPHDGFRQTSGAFTTGTHTLKPLEGTPGITVIDAWTEKDKACGYDIARRYWIDTTLLQEDDASGAAVFHLYALDEHGDPGEIIHTIFTGTPTKAEEPLGLKQYLDGSLPQTDCFRVIEEDGAGNQTPWAEACFEPGSGGSDSGGSDTATPDSGDTAVSDSGGSDSGGSDSGNAVEPATSEDCGCGGGAPAVLLLPLILRRRTAPGTARSPRPTGHRPPGSPRR